MKANIINLERYQDEKTLTTLVLKMTRQINVNHIYLIPRMEPSSGHYRLIMVIEDMAKRFKQRVKDILVELLETFPNYTAHFFTPHDVLNSTLEGNTFFLNHCTKKTLIYYHHHYDAQWLFQKVNLNTISKNAHENFRKQQERILEFSVGASFYLEKENYAHATFMLHQTIEQSFLFAEYFLMGRTFTGHLISDHQNYLGNEVFEFKEIFSTDLKADTKLLNKLNKAYCDTRYRFNYKITEEQVREIRKRADSLIQLVRKYADIELHTYEVMLKGKPITPSQNSNERQKDKSLETNKNLEMWSKIRELGQNSFLTMTPIKSGRKGYYLKYARIYDYFDLICLLHSTLNVCILALEDTQDCTLEIRNKESDVKAVLNFAKNLIPLEEATFLDQMRELLKLDDEL